MTDTIIFGSVSDNFRKSLGDPYEPPQGEIYGSSADNSQWVITLILSQVKELSIKKLKL